jgi:hypothetical protein
VLLIGKVVVGLSAKVDLVPRRISRLGIARQSSLTANTAYRQPIVGRRACAGTAMASMSIASDPDANANAGQELGLTSAMQEESTNHGSYPSDIASDPPYAAHSLNLRQVKDDPTSQQCLLPEGPGSITPNRVLRSTHQVGKRSHQPSDKVFIDKR